MYIDFVVQILSLMFWLFLGKDANNNYVQRYIRGINLTIAIICPTFRMYKVSKPRIRDEKIH